MKGSLKNYKIMLCLCNSYFHTVYLLSYPLWNQSLFGLCSIFSGLKLFYGKKTRLKNEITKRRQEDSVQAEDAGQVCYFLFTLNCNCHERRVCLVCLLWQVALHSTEQTIQKKLWNPGPADVSQADESAVWANSNVRDTDTVFLWLSPSLRVVVSGRMLLFLCRRLLIWVRAIVCGSPVTITWPNNILPI